MSPRRDAAAASRDRYSGIFEPILIALTRDAAASFGRPVDLVPEQAQERPFSHVMRVAVRDRDHDEPFTRVYVKAFKPKTIDGDADAIRKRVVHDFETTRRVHASMAGLDHLGAVRPVACYPEHLALVTEEAEGATLFEYLHQHATWRPAAATLDELRRTVAAVGEWVQLFQRTIDNTAVVSVAELTSYLDHRLRQLVQRHTFADGVRDGILRHATTLGDSIPAPALRAVAVHSDMSLGNVLVSGPRIVVLDFAMARTGTRLHDVTRLFLQLDLLRAKPMFSGRVIRGLQDSLLSGFDAELTAEDPLFRLHLLMHRVNHLLTLTNAPAALPVRIYNSMLRRRHRQWIDDEVGRRSGVLSR